MTERSPIAAAILAGGLARRMAGVNKATLRVGDRRIVDRQLALLRQVADPVFIVSNHREAFSNLGVEVLPDVIPNAGPLGGIYTAIRASPHPRTIVVAGDMPFLTLALLRHLAADSTADLVIPQSAARYEPLCATWSAAAAEVVRRQIERGILKAALLVKELHVETIGPAILASCDPHGLLFVNVNTPHDYERAQGLSHLESNRPGIVS